MQHHREKEAMKMRERISKKRDMRDSKGAEKLRNNDRKRRA